MLQENPYHIIVTDFFLPNETVNLLDLIRTNRPEASVIILTGFGTLETAVVAIREGCFDYLQKPVKIDQLIEVINRAEKKFEESENLQEKAAGARSTALQNELSFRDRAREEFYRAKRYQTHLSLMMAKIDDFEIGDSTLGPETGVFLMNNVIPFIKANLRLSDFVSFSGKDKVGIILPKTGKMGALEIACKLSRMFSDQEFQFNNRFLKISMSLGIASYPDDPALIHTQFIKSAEQTLDKVVRKGRNQIGLYGMDSSPSMVMWERKDRDSAKVAKLAQSKQGVWKKMKNIYVESIDSLVSTLQTRDDYYKHHSANVSHYGEEIARMLKLDDWMVESIKYAGILHDIGKVGVSESILLKPDRLTGDEFDEIKRHCEIGVKIIRDANFFQEEIPIILHHHEWFDGSGYPSGLGGDDIPIGARILGMVDTFDSLTNKRCYRREYAPMEAMEEIKKYSGLQFDPDLVNCMEQYLLAMEQ